MEKVTKVYFDPLLHTKQQIRDLLKTLPVGCAHPSSPQGVLLHHSAQNTITEIDISDLPEEYFSIAVNLAELGEETLERIKLFPTLRKFSDEYTIQQAPSPTFRLPLVNGEIAIFAVSKRAPTFYDLCLADSKKNTTNWSALDTFRGLHHSGDNNMGQFLLQYVTTKTADISETEYAVFVSGYNHTLLTKYKAENPLVLLVNHQEKVLYVVPIPLDEASIGKAILCCPMVIKADKENGSLICSILPSPTTDDNLMASGPTLPSSSFREAIDRADFIGAPPPSLVISRDAPVVESEDLTVLDSTSLLPKRHLILATQSVTIPNVGRAEDSQIMRFGNGIEWITEYETTPLADRSSSVLPCIFGGILQGPLLLATGVAPRSMPFLDQAHLHRYYRDAKTVTVIVDESMTDNARNLATPWRINALFIVQVAGSETGETADILPLLEGLNINAITALAGPQSLVLAQVGKRYHFYRGIANCDCFDSGSLEFGKDVTQLLETVDFSTLMDPRWPRLVNLSEENKIFLPKSKLEILPTELLETFERTSMAGILLLKDDILAAVPQMQAILNQKDLEDLCSKLLSVMEAKVTKATAAQRMAYIQFFTEEYKAGDAESKKVKERLLGELRRTAKDLQSAIAWLPQALGNVISSQNTSTKKHDLKRMIRQNAIRSNVDAAKTMTFDSLAGLLEEHAGEMGVLLVNVHTSSYTQLLGNTGATIAEAASCCALDSRILHLEGLDAGIVLEQSQPEHHGPLLSQLGPTQPVLSLPYISENQGESGSMLAWVCWDEFVNLENPSKVRWVEKCNEAHIAALRIIMRGTLSTAVSSRDFSMTPQSEATGWLMGSLLMASMENLAKMRTTAPTPTAKATDTITKLMRGLFGHLLTVAGSGLKPMSFAWQLMGTNPQLDVPTTTMAWSWYEKLVVLFPYTGWPAQALKQNLERLLDKVIFRMIIHNKVPVTVAPAIEQLEKARAFRNVQLSHSRLVVTALIKIVSAGTESQKMAQNLLQVLPAPVENEKASYTVLYRYVEGLSSGRAIWRSGNITAANVYSRRSGAFCELKKELSKAVKGEDKAEVKLLGEKIFDKRKEIASTWHLEPDKVHVQGLERIEALYSMLPTHELSQIRKEKDVYSCIRGDAEQWRLPWQTGNGKDGTLAPLDVDTLAKVLDGTLPPAEANLSSTVVVPNPKEAREAGWEQFEKLFKEGFLSQVQKSSSVEQVCGMLKVPESMMHAFISTLAPVDFQRERLPDTFREVVFSLLKNPNTEIAKPTKQLFGSLAIEAVS